MKILKVLIPKLLTQFDNFLLLNYPHVWHTRVHYVVFYGLLSWLLLFAVGYCYPLSMYDISMDLSKVDEIKKVSSWFLWICGFFAGVFWWQKVAQFRILLGKWSHALVECGLFFVGISVIWQAMNAFKNGIEVNIAYRVSSPITQQDKQRLYERNFYMPMYLAYRNDVRQYDNISPSIFSLSNELYDEVLLKKDFLTISPPKSVVNSA